MTRVKRRNSDTTTTRNAVQDGTIGVKPDTRSSDQPLELPASTAPCPEPCLHLHRLRYPFNLAGLEGPDATKALDVLIGIREDEDFGTDCRLCGQFVHMDTWHVYYLKWRKEQGMPDLEAGR